jgi:hypothetical protein
MPLFISYFTRHLNVELNIRPGIRYPAFRLAVYPAGRISGNISTGTGIWCISSFTGNLGCICDQVGYSELFTAGYLSEHTGN